MLMFLYWWWHPNVLKLNKNTFPWKCFDNVFIMFSGNELRTIFIRRGTLIFIKHKQNRSFLIVIMKCHNWCSTFWALIWSEISYPYLLRGCWSWGYRKDKSSPSEHGAYSVNQAETANRSESAEDLCRPTSIRVGVSGWWYHIYEGITLERCDTL